MFASLIHVADRSGFGGRRQGGGGATAGCAEGADF